LNEANILVDFKVLKKEVNDIIIYLDHKDLNQLPEFADFSPSSEIIAKFIYKKVKEKFENVSRVNVWETASSCAGYWE
jgi:6-pyruvoyltetrahydropterin/6-carboxytetrahydropterin synthase